MALGPIIESECNVSIAGGRFAGIFDQTTPPPPGIFTYFQPGGLWKYKRPNGTDTYFRP